MAYGLQVWDSSGNKTLDITDRITREYATGTLTWVENEYTKTIIIPGITNDGTWFIRCSATITSINDTTHEVVLERFSNWFAYYPATTETYVIFRG